jgi:histone H3/H4
MLLPCVQRMIRVTFRLLPYWQAAARKEGYTRIEDAIIGIYRETGSMAETARRLTFSRRCISQKLKALGEPVNGPGGANNPYGRSGKPKEHSR